MLMKTLSQKTAAETSAPTLSPLLEVAGLDVFLLDAVTGQHRQILNRIDLRILPEQIVGLTGSSGSGKSTLALAVAGLLPGASEISASRWSLFGRDAASSDWPATRLSARRLKARFGPVRPTSMFFISQDARSSLVPYRSVQWHLRRASEAAGKASSVTDDAALLGRLGFADPADFLPRFPRAMSSGECQRIQFAMACRLAPRLLVADEPFASVDPAIARRLNAELRAFTTNGRSLLLISHDLPALRATADRVAILHEGRVVEEGPSAEVLDESRNHHPHTADLLRSASNVPYPALSNVSSPDAAPQSNVVLCRATGISKSFAAASPPGGPPRPQVLSNRSLVLHRGRRVGLHGRSGIGKTTLARVLLGLLDADSGTIERFPEDPHPWLQDFNRKPGEQLSHGMRAIRRLIELLAPKAEDSGCERKAELWRRMQLAYQDTDLVFDPASTVGESLSQVIRAHRPELTSRDAWSIAGDLLTRFHLPLRLLLSPPRQLSGGERRRAAIARTLAALGFPRTPADRVTATTPSPHEDRILILDEPTVGIDVFLQATLAETLLQAQAELNLTYLVISHDRTFVQRFCNEVIEWDRP
jgi:peptide/nickel transport system ATP-binding protein